SAWAAGSYGSFSIGTAGTWSYTLNNSLSATNALDTTDTATELFTITVKDEETSSTSVVTITGHGTNDAPSITNAGTGEVTEDVGTASVATGTAQAVDPDDAISYVSASAGGTYGTFAIGTNGAWSYTLNNSLSATNALDTTDTATELFTITVKDEETSSTSVVTITGHGTNDAPSITNAGTGEVTEDVGTASVATGTAQAVDPDDAISYVSASAGGTYGTFAIGTNGAWSYTLNNSLSATNALDTTDTATELFTITVKDEETSSTSVVTITGHGTNDAPSITNAGTGEVTEDVGTASVATGTAQAVDPDDAISYVSASAGGTYGTFAIGTNGAWSYTLDNSLSATNALDTTDTATERFTITASDEETSSTSVVTITVHGTNDAPSITNAGTGEVTEDVGTASVATGTAQAVDPDDTVSYVSASAGGTYGTFAIGTNGAWSYTLDNSLSATNALDTTDTATELFTITVKDEETSSTSVVTITVHGTNDAPSITNAGTGEVTEDVGTASVANGTAQALDPDDTVSYVSASAGGTYGTFAIGTNGAWSYTLDNSLSATNALDTTDTATELFTITVKDEETSSTSVVTITVHGHNDAPSITNAGTGEVTEDVGTISVATGTAQAVDPDDTVSYVSASAGGTYGSFNIGTNGAWSYTLNNSLSATNALDTTDTATELFTITVKDEETSSTS